MLDQLHAVTFSNHLHTPFRILPSSMPAQDLELVQVHEHHAADGQQPWVATGQERFFDSLPGGV